jgi:photosystem II stability/assembly factor-like uncharacterized protein
MTLERDGDSWRETGGTLTNHEFTSLARAEGSLLAGAVDGIFRSTDEGQTWWESSEGLTTRHIRSLAYHPEDADLAFAGTEPAEIFVSEDGGRSWSPRPEVSTLRDENGWFLPYSPAAGCVRGFAFHGERGYAAVEQGGLLKSEDQGATWYVAKGSTGKPRVTLPEGFIHADVHFVHVHPSSSDQVFAPTGGGLYYSTDGGESWVQLHPAYCRAVWADPTRARRLVLGPADGPDRNGRIVRSINGGDTWEKAMDGLAQHWPDYMVSSFVQVDDELLAVLSNGEMIAAPLSSLGWRTILAKVHQVRAVVPLAS